MAQLLGTSFVASQDAGASYTVELSRFGVMAPMDSVDAISLVLGALVDPVKEADLGPVELGKVISNSSQSEAGLFVHLSATEGAAVSAVCPRLTTQVKLSVGKSSKALRYVMWTVLGVAVVGGVLGAHALLPDWDVQVRLAIGLLGGAAFAVAVLVVLTRFQLLASGRSGELARKLDVVVRSWVNGEEAPKRKKRRKKNRSAEADG